MRVKVKLSSDEMVAMLRGGMTFREVARRANVCPTRVRRIVGDQVPPRWTMRKRKRQSPMVKVYVGAKLHVDVKRALIAYSKRTGESISSFISDAIEEKLKSLGVVIETAPVNRGEPLPFEGEE